jgi:hypothetical protein
LVAEGDRLVGILSLKDLLSFLYLKIELEGADAEGVESHTGKRESGRRKTESSLGSAGPLTGRD